MKTLFIGVSGVAASGKDLFFNLLKRELDERGIPAYKYSLADSLKEEVNGYLKEHYQIDIFNCTRREKDSVRPFLVFHGSMKRVESEGRHWIEILDKKITEENLTGVVCVTDIRYDEFEGDEVDWVKGELGGVLVHIKREGIKPANKEETKQDPSLINKSNYKIEWPTLQGCQKDIESQLIEQYITKFADWLLNDHGLILSEQSKRERLRK